MSTPVRPRLNLLVLPFVAFVSKFVFHHNIHYSLLQLSHVMFKYIYSDWECLPQLLLASIYRTHRLSAFTSLMPRNKKILTTNKPATKKKILPAKALMNKSGILSNFGFTMPGLKRICTVFAMVSRTNKPHTQKST